MPQHVSLFNDRVIIHCVNRSHFVYPFTKLSFKLFLLFWVLWGMLLRTFIYTSFLVGICFKFSWYMPRCRTAESYGNSDFYKGTAKLFYQSIFLLLSVESSLHIMGRSPLSDKWFEDIFLHSLSSLSFAKQKCNFSI